MRFVCTIYTPDHSFTTGSAEGGSGSGGDGVMVTARVEVAGKDKRDAAARAWVHCVGRERARLLRERLKAPRSVIAQETNCRAIAASLRKTTTWLGECYEMDNLLEAWYITVEPTDADAPLAQTLPNSRLTSESDLPGARAPQKKHKKPSRFRLPYPVLRRLLRSHSPN